MTQIIKIIERIDEGVIQGYATVRLTVTDRGGWSRSDPSGAFRGVPKLLKLIGFMLYDERFATPAVE